MGTSLVSISDIGAVTVLGDVGSGGQCTLTYSFDRLAISSGGRMYYYFDETLTQVTDPDLGTVLDVTWVDGYFMTTDGESLVVTELNDPFSVNPLKYGSSEVDPDPINGILKIRNEIYAINRYTIEVFQDIGGQYFPFQRVAGASISRGAIGTYCSTEFLDSVAFLGSSRNEAPAVWLGANGNSTNISSREIDQILATYTEAQLAEAVLETRVLNAQKLLYVHLTNRTLVYDAAASQVLARPIWVVLTSSNGGLATYRARNFVWCYDKWLVGDPTSTSHGYLSYTLATHYGNTIGWEFNTPITYNGGALLVYSEIELVCITGRVVPGVNPTIWTSYTTDGTTWSQEKPRSLGTTGQTEKRITWFSQGFTRNWRCQKFRGNSDSLLSISRLEVTVT